MAEAPEAGVGADEDASAGVPLEREEPSTDESASPSGAVGVVAGPALSVAEAAASVVLLETSRAHGGDRTGRGTLLELPLLTSAMMVPDESRMRGKSE